MDKPVRPVTIGVFGHYGNENLGDEAIIEAVVQNLKKRRQDVRLIGFSIDPVDTAERYGMPAYPIRSSCRKRNTSAGAQSVTPTPVPTSGGKRKQTSRLGRLLKQIPLLGLGLRLTRRGLSLVTDFIEEASFLRESYGKVKELDLLMITGSNQFLDNFGGTWGFPYTLLKWSIMARLAGVKVFYVSVGAGPVYRDASKRLIRWALRFSDYTSFRDQPSRELVESFGFKGESEVYPDLAHSLYSDVDFRARAGEERPSVAINPMPVYDSRYWYTTDDNEFQTYTSKLAQFARRLIDEGYPVFFYATQPKDENVIRDVLDKLEKTGLSAEFVAGLARKSRDIETFLAILNEADIAVTTRFHGAVLALFAEKPVLGICYYRKTDDLLKAYGMGDYSLVLESMQVEEMLEKFRMLERDHQSLKASIRDRNDEYRAALDKQYEHILEVLEEDR